MKKLLLLLSIVCIGQVNGQIITTIAGNGTAGYSGDGGQATAAELYHPRDVFIDASGNIYIADFINANVRKVNTAGIISTIAGNGTQGYSGDGGQATAAKLFDPSGVTVDTKGNVYIADYQNNRIRMVNTAGIISTFAGTGTQGYSGDGGQATSAELAWPDGVALDVVGNLYIADESNNRIRKVDTMGIITTIAGNGPLGAGSFFSGDGGQATNAELDNPVGVTLDAAGNMYISDAVNQRIRKVNTAGIITTIAGNGTVGYSGDGGQATAAELCYPSKVVVDTMGNIYIADNCSNRIRMINTSGIITTIAGNGTQGYSGDCGQATAAELWESIAIAFDKFGNLYIADESNSRIRKVSSQTCTNGIEQLSMHNEQITIYPNPTSDQFFIDANTTDKLTVDLYDVNGRHVFSKSVNNKSNISVATLDNGIYTLTIKTADRVVNKKLVIVH